MGEEQPGDDNKDVSSQIVIVRWTDRFLAWLIDVVIVSVVIFGIIGLGFGLINFEQGMSDEFESSEWLQFFPTSLVFFAYWLILESTSGQSIGKKVLGIKITNLRGQKASVKSIAISSFGKAFLLPIDLIIGWIFTNKKRQRIFNRLGDTIIVKVQDEKEEPEDVTYKKD